MSKPANKTLIGIFVLGAIALVVVAIVVLGSGKFFKETFTAVCFFEGSVGGLNVGSPVVFRGVKIGSVTNIVLSYNPKNLVIRIPVYIEIDPSSFKPIGPTAVRARPGRNLKILIDRGLRASLEMQSIVTGQLQVGLDFHPDKPATYVGDVPEYQEIPTVPTPLQELAKKIEKIPIEEIFEKLLSAIEGIEKVVKSPEIEEAIRSIKLALADVRELVQNVDGRVGPLASNLNDAVQDVRKLVKNVDGQVGSVTANLNDAVIDIRKLIQNADAKVAGLAFSLDETVKETRGLIRNADGRIGSLAASIEGTLKSAEATVELAEKAIEGIEGTLGEDSTLVYELNKTLEEISALARSIRVLSDYLQRRPESAIWGK